MIELGKVKSLDDLPENIRSIFTEENGIVSLDESKIRTEEDVAKIKKAKDDERNLGNAAKAELKKFQAIGQTPEEIADKIADLESRAGNGTEQTERLANLQKAYRKSQADYSALKSELDSIKPDYEKVKGEIVQRRTGDALASFVKTLKNVDSEKLSRYLKKDIQLGFINLDESGEGLVCKDGSKLEDYAMTTAKDLGFMLKNTPGESRSGSEKFSETARNNTGVFAPESASGNIFDDETTAMLNK